MTYLEKYMHKHPGADTEHVVKYECPPGEREAGEGCHLPLSCEDCWNRDITNIGPDFAEAKRAIEEDSGVTVTAEPIIKDSGDRTEFATGAVRDMHAGKGRMDLLPWGAIMEVSKHCEEGALKYGEHTADKGIPTHSLCDSAARHLAKYLDGWTDEPHRRAAVWNLLWALQMELKHPELVDTPWKDK